MIRVRSGRQAVLPHTQTDLLAEPACPLSLAGLVVEAEDVPPDPISNSAVKASSAHGTVPQGTGESVTARPAKLKPGRPPPHDHAQPDPRIQAPAVPVGPLRTGPKDASLRFARRCYDHVAGRLGVAITDRLLDDGAIVFDADAGQLTERLGESLRGLGIE